jgi:hypothetical protein
MQDGTATKLVRVVAPSPMPVLLTKPSPDSRFSDEPTVRVIPGLIRLGSRPYRLKEVAWINQTSEDVTITFDPAGSARYFDPPQLSPIVVHNGETRTLKLSDSPPENSIYTYQVDCKVTPNRPAQGDSPPSMACP